MKVHFDMNIIEQEFNYIVSFTIESATSNYVGLLAQDSITVYVGSAPIQGSCDTDKDFALAIFDIVNISVDNWTDKDGIGRYDYSFSYDGGNIYVPITKSFAI